MLKLQIPKNRMNYLIKQIPLHFDAAVLEQGWEYYHKGRVADVDLKGTSIQSTVAGKRLHNTTVNLEHFQDSSCSCSFDGFCQHIGATFFSLYALRTAGTAAATIKATNIRSQETTAGTSLAQERKEAAKANKPEEAAMPADWHRFSKEDFMDSRSRISTPLKRFMTLR